MKDAFKKCFGGTLGILCAIAVTGWFLNTGISAKTETETKEESKEEEA